jgi:signal transduction histidine kinase
LTGWVQAFNNPIEYQGRPAVLTTTIDITERKQAEEEIRRHAARMEVLAEISRTFAEAGLDYQSVLNTVARRTAELIGDSCVMTLFSDDQQRSYPVSFYHRDPKALAMMHEALMYTWQGGTDTQRYQTLLSGNSIYVPAVNPQEFRASLEPEFLPYLDAIGISSFIIVPLRVQSQVIGTLGITRDRHGSSYTPDDLVFLQDLADRAALTIQNVRLFEQVQGAHERLQTLSRRLLEVQEAERRHVARELHDEIGQVLTSLKLLLDTSTLLPALNNLSRLDEARLLVSELMDRVEELSLDLRPEMLDELGLLPTLLGHFERYTYQTNIQVIFRQNGLEGRRFSPEIETTVYRIIQEALTNVARHAKVDEATVRLWVGQDMLGVEIEDRGIGFDPLALGVSPGLSGMRERVALLGGQLMIESAPGSGTSITAELPLPVPAERSDTNDDNRAGG